MLEAKEQEYLESKQLLHPRGYEDAHAYFADSLVLTTRAETYQTIIESLSDDAFESIFEESK
jgi:hypothetical protein